MKASPALFVALSLFTATACSSGEFDTLANDAEGIYQIQSHNENSLACEPGGDSLLGPDSDQYLVAQKRDVFGTPLLYVWSCASPADCRAKLAAFDAGQSIQLDFSFIMHDADGDALIGGGASTGFGIDGVCTEGTVTETAITVDANGLSLVQQTTLADDYAQDGDGFCTTDLARDAAAGNACSEMTTLTAVYVEPL